MVIKTIEELKNSVESKTNEEFELSLCTTEITISRELALELLKISNKEHIAELEKENKMLKKDNKYWITNSEALKKSREYILEENKELTREKNRVQKINEGLLGKQSELNEQVKALTDEKTKWYNAYHKLIMKPF